jgi:hypothetical protein
MKKWERTILAALEQQSVIILTDLIPRPYSYKRHCVVYQAAEALRRADKVHVRRVPRFIKSDDLPRAERKYIELIEAIEPAPSSGGQR